MDSDRHGTNVTTKERRKELFTRWLQYGAVLAFLIGLVALSWWFAAWREDEQPAVAIGAGLVSIFAAFGALFFVLPHAVIGRRFGEEFIPIPGRYGPGHGAEFSQEVGSAAQRLSLALLLIGWFLLTCSVLLAITGSLIGHVDGKGKNEEILANTVVAGLLENPGLLCSTLAVIGAALGWQCLDRSQSATRLASIANLAIASSHLDDGDLRAFRTCIRAKSAWLEGRLNTERLEGMTRLLGAVDDPDDPGASDSGAAEKSERVTRNGGVSGS